MQRLLTKIAELESWEDKYEMLVEAGRGLEPFDEKLKTSENLVEGCSSKAWLDITLQNGKMSIRAESKSLMVKGLLALIIDEFNGREPKYVLNYDVAREFAVIDLSELLTPVRVNGFNSVVKQIKITALVYANQSQS